MRRSRPASSCSTLSTGMAAMVVQFGLAMMPLGACRASSGFTSLTTRGTSGSIRQAEELSITIAPAAAKRGACTFDVAPPAENSAMSMPDRSAVSASSTTMSWTLPSGATHGRVVPAERAEAKKRISSTGKRRSASRRRITPPTWPVAPTTAMRLTGDPFRSNKGGRDGSAAGAAVDDGGLVVRAELERVVYRADRGVELDVAADDGDPDLGGGDHLDVDARVGQGREQLGRDAGVR